MRWLVVSDLHYGLRQYDWVAAVAAEFDLVVIAGDLLDLRSAVPIPAQSVAISRDLARIGRVRTVVAASGNHDLDGRDEDGEKTAHWLQGARGAGVWVDGDTFVQDGTLVTICPWWDGPAGQARLAQRLEEDAARERLRWAWVYHAPPAGSPLAHDGRREYGDDVLSDWIARFEPDVVLTGHIHQSPFTGQGGWSDQIGRTWVFNAGREPGPVPAHIVLDFEQGHARWSSSEGSETRRLDIA